MSDDTIQQTTTTQELSPIEDARQTLKLLQEAKAQAKAEADRLEKIKADNLLSGTAGLRPSMPEPKIETAKEYAQRIFRGDFNGKSI